MFHGLSNMELQEAKQRLPVPELWKRLGLPGQPGRVCKSPWREDRKPSLSISADGMLWNDFGEGVGGDAICFLERACGLSRKEACLKFIEMAGGTAVVPKAAPRTTKPTEQHRERPELPSLSIGMPEQHKRLAKLRGLRTEAIEMAVGLGLLHFCVWQGEPAWLITDGTRVNAQVRRMDGKPWGEVKAKTLPGSWAKWPIGMPTDKPSVLLVEGGPDLLAACQLILDERGKDITAPVCMFGSALEIYPLAVPLFRGKRVTMVPHRDAAGEKARARWERQLTGVVRSFSAMALPVDVKDLNDLLKYDDQPNQRKCEEWI